MVEDFRIGFDDDCEGEAGLSISYNKENVSYRFCVYKKLNDIERYNLQVSKNLESSQMIKQMNYEIKEASVEEIIEYMKGLGKEYNSGLK